MSESDLIHSLETGINATPQAWISASGTHIHKHQIYRDLIDDAIPSARFTRRQQILALYRRLAENRTAGDLRLVDGFENTREDVNTFQRELRIQAGAGAAGINANAALNITNQQRQATVNIVRGQVITPIVDTTQAFNAANLPANLLQPRARALEVNIGGFKTRRAASPVNADTALWKWRLYPIKPLHILLYGKKHRIGVHKHFANEKYLGVRRVMNPEFVVQMGKQGY